MTGKVMVEAFRGDEEVGIHAFTEGRFLPQLVFHSHVFFNLFLLCSHRRQEDAFSSSVGFRSSHLLISCRRWFYFYLVGLSCGGVCQNDTKKKGGDPRLYCHLQDRCTSCKENKALVQVYLYIYSSQLSSIIF